MSTHLMLPWSSSVFINLYNSLSYSSTTSPPSRFPSYTRSIHGPPHGTLYRGPNLSLTLYKSVPKPLLPVSWQEGQSNATAQKSSNSERRIIMAVSTFTGIFWPRGLLTAIGFRERENNGVCKPVFKETWCPLAPGPAGWWRPHSVGERYLPSRWRYLKHRRNTGLGPPLSPLFYGWGWWWAGC